MNSPHITSEMEALDQFSIISKADIKGRITYVNEKFCEISGYRQDELLGSPHSIINSGYHPREFFKELWATIGKGNIWQGEIRNKGKNGRYYWVFTTIVPLLGENGRPKEYFSLRIDITQRKEAEKQLMRQHESLSRYAYISSHDLRYPIEEMKSFIDNILKGDKPVERDHLRNLKTHVNELETLCRLLKDLVSGNGMELGLVRKMSRRLPAQHIMLIDDDKMHTAYSNSIIQKVISTAEVVSYTNPVEAISSLKHEQLRKPEVLFLDLKMPVIDGFEFLNEAEAHLRDTDVHILSEAADPQLIEQSQNWPCVKSYIRKPLTESKLQSVLNPKVQVL